MGEPEIGRCVFCRSDNLVVSGEGHYFVSCRDCDSTGPIVKSRADAIAKWNAVPRQPAREYTPADLDALCAWSRRVHSLTVALTTARARLSESSLAGYDAAEAQVQAAARELAALRNPNTRNDNG